MQYRRALEYFMTGLKYEQNPASKKMILERVDGYMKRAEEIKTVLNSRNGSAPSSTGSSVQTISKDEEKKGGKDEKDEEKNKLRGTYSCACIPRPTLSHLIDWLTAEPHPHHPYLLLLLQAICPRRSSPRSRMSSGTMWLDWKAPRRPSRR